MQMDKEIVKITLDDYYKCRNIWDMKNCPYTESFINQIKAGNRMVYVYKINNEFIGEGNLVIKSDEKDYTIPNKRVHISHLMVKKEFRNQGIGAEILDFLIETAKKMGYSEISLGVDCGNDAAVHIYRKKGFEIFFIDKDEQGEYYKMLKSI